MSRFEPIALHGGQSEGESPSWRDGVATTGMIALGGCADALRGDSVDAASMQWSEARLLG